MGKRKTRREKSLKPVDPTAGLRIPAIIYRAPEDRTRPSEQPKLIPPTTFQMISNVMLETVPPHRNVFLSMSEYRIQDVNPMFNETSESPTHMIIFCLRLIVSDQFHPIGVVQLDKRIDQTAKLVCVWKTFLQDLSLLRLIVIGTISPPSMTFHRILRELTKIPNMKEYTGPITYSVWPYKDIVHLYDYCYLLHETQEALFERNEMCFMACPPSEEKSCSLQLWTASWTDILLVLTSQGINCYYTTEDRNAIPLDIFYADFWKTYQQAGEDGLMDTDSKESTDRLMELLCPFGSSLEDHTPFMCPYDLQNFYDNNEELRILLTTAKYKKATAPFSGESSPEISSISTKEMFHDSISEDVLEDENVSAKTNSMEIGDNQMNNILNIIDSSLNHVEKNPFDIFLQKITYDDYDLYLKTSSKIVSQSKEMEVPSEEMKEEEGEIKTEEEREEKAFDSIRHDHDYFRNRSPEKSPPKKAGNSTIYNLVNDFFGKDLDLLSLRPLEHHTLEAMSNVSKNLSSSKTIAENTSTVQVSETKNSDHENEPYINVTFCNKETDKFPHKRSRHSGSCEKSTVSKKGEDGKRKIKGSTVDQLLHTPMNRGCKVKTKRLRNKGNDQRLISSLPYIFGENFSVGEYYYLVSGAYPGDEEILSLKINSGNTTDHITLTIPEDETKQVPENQKIDNINTVAVETREKDSCVLSVIKVQNEQCKDDAMDYNDSKLRSTDTTPLVKDTISDGEVNINIPQCSYDSLVSDDNTHNKANDMLKPAIPIGQSLKERVEDFSDSPLDNMKNIRMEIYEKSEINIPDKKILYEAPLKKRIHEKRLLEHLTKSILDTAIQDFLNILASYKRALEKSKNGGSDKSEDEVLDSVNGCNSQLKEREENENYPNLQDSDSDSIDSLTELFTSIETDHTPTQIPCKYTIPKTSNTTVKYRQETPCQELDENDKPHDVITENLFYQIMQKRSLELSQNLEETVIKHTLNMLDKTLEDYSQDFEERNQNDSPPLSNPDSLEDYRSNKTGTLSHFVVNTSLHENVNKMFITSNQNFGEPNTAKPDDMDSIPDLEESFLAVANSSVYTETGLDKENINDKNFEEERNTTFDIDTNENSSETMNVMIFKSVGFGDQNNETFVIQNAIEEQWHSESIDIMPCCKIASTSNHDHSPSCNVKAPIFLPHYTRFGKSCSGSTSSSASIDPKESQPKEENIANSTVASDRSGIVDNVFSTESTAVSDADVKKCDGIEETYDFPGYYKPLDATVSIDEGNEDITNEDEYEPDKPNNYVECKANKSTSDLGISLVNENDTCSPSETLSTQTKKNPNVSVADVAMDGSTAMHDKILKKPSLKSLGFAGYFKHLENAPSGDKSNNVTSEDEEYQPDEPNDYTQYKHPTDNNDKNTEELKQEESTDYVDYKEYKRSLEACDNQESKCDIIYRDRKTFERLSNQIPDDFETLRVTTDWLCTFKGYVKLKEILVARKVRQFQASALSLEHIDFLVHLVRKAKNNAPSEYDGPTYKFFDLKIAFEPLFLGKGVYMIKTDTDVNNMSL